VLTTPHREKPLLRNIHKARCFLWRENNPGDEITGEWRKLHEELRDLCSLPNIVRVVKSRRMRWAEHVARMGEVRGVHRVLVGKPEGEKHWGDPDVNGRIILRWIFGKWEGMETGWSWLRIGTDGGHL